MDKIKILRVGDSHATIANLSDSEKLMDFIFKTAKEQKVDRIELMGDLFHTHSIIRSEIMDYWYRFFKRVSDEEILTIALVGNHDQIGDNEREHIHALTPFKNYPYLIIVDKLLIKGPFAYIASRHSEEEFLQLANQAFVDECKVLMCHQTFQGCTFENGFYAENGFDLSKVPMPIVISGHIHKAQFMGKCDYIGTPKWDIATDAGQDKGIYVFTHDKNTGNVLSREFFSTKDIVTPIYSVKIVEGDEEPIIPTKGRIAFELVGQAAWVTKMKKKLKGKGSIRAKITDRKNVSVDQGKLLSIDEFVLKNFNPIVGVTKEDVVSYIRGVSAI